MVAVDRLGEHVVDAVLRLVLVHRDLLEHDLALGVDLVRRQRRARAASRPSGRTPPSVCSSRKRACRCVVSLLVAALVAAPMPSNSSEISIAEWRSVPLNSRCSRKCETPACAGVSSRDPVLTQSPRATERTEGTTSVTTRRPRVELRQLDALGQRGSSVAALPLTAAASAAVATVAAATAAAAAAIAAVAAAAAAAAAHRRVARAELLQLLRALALDRRVVGEPQADPAALLVDLGHGDVDLVARLRARPRPSSTRSPGLTFEMCSRPSVPLTSSTKAPNVVVLTTLRLREVVADLGLPGHRLDPLDARPRPGRRSARRRGRCRRRRCRSRPRTPPACRGSSRRPCRSRRRSSPGRS